MESGDYIGLLEQFHTETRNWKSELEFYKLEIGFLHSMIDKLLLNAGKNCHDAGVCDVLKALFDWSVSDKAATAVLNQQDEQLAKAYADTSSTDTVIIGRQEYLRRTFDDLRCEYQQLKTALYQLEDNLLKEADLKNTGTSVQ